jgi:hypothetical protein
MTLLSNRTFSSITNFNGKLKVSTGVSLYVLDKGNGIPILCIPGALGTAKVVILRINNVYAATIIEFINQQHTINRPISPINSRDYRADSD